MIVGKGRWLNGEETRSNKRKKTFTLVGVKRFFDSGFDFKEFKLPLPTASKETFYQKLFEENFFQRSLQEKK